MIRSRILRAALGKTVLLGYIAISLSGCMATLEHRPAYARVCKATDMRSWSGKANGAWLERDGKQYWLFSFLDEGSTQKFHGPINNVYWVMFSVGIFGSAAGVPILPIVYDPSSAIVRIGGRELHALPRLWTAEQRDGVFVPLQELPVPARLNAQGMPWLSWFYMAFPVPKPRATDIWQVDGGTILLDGKAVPLPVGESCFTPSRTWWAPII